MSLTFRKNRRGNFIPYFLLTFFVCGALGTGGLFATEVLTATVTTYIDDGTGNSGTLSSAIGKAS